MKPKTPPTKKERHRMLIDHNLPQLMRSISRVQKSVRKLDCALSELNLYANILAPHITRSKGGGK